ncbi:ComF family protein [Rathayibacter sp. VKM Ac-2835]|uniref:ComF family protein n=1 Tax=Rathayibacter sp. VKM Ac-2835 TaxID=2739043 RepID=UPI0015639184|nr:phosphoribosyltransferase family protein [Rathayibacter sp. VKM Ac-2835]NRG39946.1 ComF family protein [Rathayibacter sp. VKM Ac-2835]
MLRDHLLDALAVLLPVDCPACGLPVTRVPCADCASALAGEARPHLRRLGPDDDPLEVLVGAEYSGTVRRLVLALKAEGRVAAARPLGALLRPVVLGALDGAPALLVAPPRSRLRHLRRGFDPVDLLVRSAGGRLARPLARTRLALDQVGLARAERRANLDGAFRARRPLRGERILLVDDVVTSGATLLELRRAVRAGGGAVAGAVALAGTPRRRSATS